MRFGLTSLSSAWRGCNPIPIARPPQNGSTYRWLVYRSQIGARCGTSQRLPPAHFNGGLIVFSGATVTTDEKIPQIRPRKSQRAKCVIQRMQRRRECQRFPVRQGGDEERAKRRNEGVAFAVHDLEIE